MRIQFIVNPRDTTNHYYHVTMKWVAVNDATQLVMPSWTPGSYMIRDYARHVHGFQASQPWEQTGLSEWTIQGKGEIQVDYKVYAYDDLTVRTNYLDEDFGFINPCGLFFYPRGEEKSNIVVHFDLGGVFPRVVTALPGQDEVHFEARDYDHLFDSPFLITHAKPWSFESSGTKYDVLVEGSLTGAQADQLLADLQIITEKQADMMGGNPNSYYLFVLILLEGGYGGLEHADSSINIFDPNKMSDPKEYKKLLELLSHEYFHLWNVKRIRPLALGPFDYENPNLTRELWIAEGITSFYDAYILLQTGHLSEEEYLEKIYEDILILEDNLGEENMSLEESSLTAWNKFYKRTPNSHNTGISYYTKGAILVLCMQIRILLETNGKKDFTLVMRELYNRFYLNLGRGFSKQEFFDVAQDVTGLDLRPEFESYLFYPRRIPVYDYLAYLGVEKVEEQAVADLGFTCKESPSGLTIQKIYESKIDPHAGLYLGDEILGLDGQRIRTNVQLTELTKKMNPGKKVELAFSRKNKIRSTELVLGKMYAIRKLQFCCWEEGNEKSSSPGVANSNLWLRKSFFQKFRSR